ncbi:long-chain-fatty-acid--CoA ligase [Rhodococcus hoagii]|jgi:fatty-acyl-CoA synthase|uniref:Acyl-CoA ligase/synthetase n=1 Tax=Rhodococcus hoagii (strain 103S) TaxID=685727 RepID=A0A3S5YD83_RHOH1|nr:long-chain fatty acid--CoA ligase [Prescottella equi]GBF16710.1 long-chain-fatty-acid--CoA ligase [Rhodococcus sp. Br-6]MBM4474096.1 long-chain-fatty-acid--CoA ligase [Prescottella equi]MBM4589288.1 long-chain-fatty-acid--CoA ligase [Prescottella equi]MBM4635278.1 long-chain-fatty-acid--CoA ligase [Prescottella equi]MBM4640815.1 long-chain-fatty-acid--CoA ligase [Prescottella equi]
MLSTMNDLPLSIAQLLRHGSTVHADAEVVTWTEAGARRRTYAEVGRRCAQLAHALRGLGVDGDDRVATFMWNNAEHLEAYLAVPSMGAVLHTLNIRLFPEQLVHVANHAEDRVIIVDATLVPLLAPQLPQLKTVEHVIVTGESTAGLEAPEGVQVHTYEDLIAGESTEYDWPELDERSAAAMCYTSGTTGDPKGVVYSHRSIYLHSMQVCMSDGPNLAQGDRALAVVPQFHAMSWGLPYAAFMIGASLIMPDRFLQPGPLAELIAAERPTFAAAVPTIWQGLHLHLEHHPQDISSMREVLIGGAAVPPSLMHAFENDHQVSVLHAWGMTETSPVGSVARPPAEATGEERWKYRYTQGRFPASVEARLIDDDGNRVPHDGTSIGELEVRGPWITASYYGVEAPDKFRDGWLRTGDVGSITPDGYLTLSDRTKDIIKSGGEWISSVDLENAVMGHPAVAEAAVIGIPDEKWDERPLVAVVLREGSDTTLDQLRDFLADKVAKWQLPENWAVIQEVPKTSVGKFDKKRLRADFHDGSLDITRL